MQCCSKSHRKGVAGCKGGPSFAWEMDFEKIHFEGDARSAVDYIKENKCDLSYNGSVIRDGFLSTSWFECFKVVLCLELVINKMADHLAYL